MLCLARLIRCAIVGSGTRNAPAISAVVSPPTARRVSAICDGAESAGWQHMNSSVSVSSASGAASSSRAASAAVRSRLRRASSLRQRSASRRDATVNSHAGGSSGTPSAGHCTAAAISASWTASSHASKRP
jgi:hypothetical protein